MNEQRSMMQVFLIGIGIIVFTAIYCLTQIPKNEREGGATGQTPEKRADIGQNPEKDEYKTILMNVSAFCSCESCCGIWADGQTASGHWIRLGDKFVAAPSKYPFGTIMDVPGYGRVPVLDRGGAIKGNKLDLYFQSHQAALNFGRRQLKVKIIK